MKNYFKKFSIMFAMLLTVIGIGIIQNGSVANAATVGSQLTSPESGWARYDDMNKNIEYYGNTSGSELSGRNNAYNSSEHFIFDDTSNSAEINFKFYGTKFRIIGNTYITTSPYSRSSNIAIYVDNNYIKSISSVSSSDIMQCMYGEVTGLSPEIHSVIIINKQSGKLIPFDALDIDNTGYLINPNESISLNQSSINLTEGNSQQLTTTPAGIGVTWSSSDTSIATVDSTGKVTAVKEGQATITATMTDGSNLSATCIVNITNPITPGITLNKTSDSLTTGQTDNLVATTTPSGAQVIWTSSDSSIATVDSIGKITTIKAGTVTITASTSSGLTATCAVTVINSTNNTGGTSTGTDGTGTIVNIAHAKGENTNNAGGDVSIIFNGLPDTELSVVKTADVKSVYVGDTFTYTIVVTNTGTKTAKSVVINDSAPNHIQFMPSGITTTQGTVDPSSTFSNILVNVGDIPPLGTVTIKIPATVIL